MALDPITDYSRTQKIVLLVDLNPILHLQNPAPYLTSIVSSAKVLLYFSPLSPSSLFAFKLFFSSLSPLLSSSRLRSLIPSCPLSLSFDHATATFDSLSNALNSLSNLLKYPLCEFPDSSPPQVSCLAASMQQLLHDYAWDHVMGDSEFGTLSVSCDLVSVRSNLVVLFSPFSKSVRSLSRLLNVATDDECLGNVDLFSKKFCTIFENVNDAFVRMDIQISWIDVRYDSSEKMIEDGDLQLGFGFFECGFRNLGWGFCSTDPIVLGSALLPFGLIYPKIGMNSRNFDLDESQKKTRVKLHLQILDRSGKPLDCKFCDLELIDWKTLSKNGPDDSLLRRVLQKDSKRRKISWEGFDDGIANFHVKSVRRCSDLIECKMHLSDPILIREFSEVSAKNIQGNTDKFFADEVLEMLSLELGDSKKPKPLPIFQLLLSFLYREGYCALVSISNGNGGSHLAILKPFMVSSALLFIMDDEFYIHELEPADEDRNLKELDKENKRKSCELNVVLNQSCSSVNYEASPSVRCSQNGEDKRKERKLNRQLIQNFKLRDFYRAAFDHQKIELEDAYFDRYCNSSKKLKFLKCWVKQIKKSTLCGLMLLKKSEVQQDILIRKDNRLTQLREESEELATTSALVSDKENSLIGASRPLAEATIDHLSGTSEDFFNNLQSKIQQGLVSEVVDLGALAEQLVSLAIIWLNQKHEVEGTSDNQPNAGKSDSANSFTIVVELNKLLLRDPKDVATKPKDNDLHLSFEESRPGSRRPASENIAREHELQILFRMEILRSTIGFSISEFMKQKFIKHICLLLENVQCHLEGGFFSGWSLKNYVEGVIKSRYCQSLGDVVNRVYEKMDLLLFAEENESHTDPFISEDSNHSWRHNSESGEVGDNYSLKGQFPTGNKLHENNTELSQPVEDEYTCKLIKAQESREKARRYARLSSRAPYLHSVWAPKQTKARKS